MSTVRVVLGAVVALIGLLFAGQGLNLVPGSFMTGDRTWFWVGLVLLVIGIVLVVSGLRRRPAARP
jgi:glucose dehydrogenase